MVHLFHVFFVVVEKIAPTACPAAPASAYPSSFFANTPSWFRVLAYGGTNENYGSHACPRGILRRTVRRAAGYGW